MLPHQSILQLPRTVKHRRRTLQVAAPDSDSAASAAASTHYELHIRELSIDQAGLGCAAWDASILLARFLHAHRHLPPYELSGKTALELGSGVGLPGLVCGRYAHRAVLSDYDEACVSNLRYNIAVNSRGAEDEDEQLTAEQRRCRRNLAAATSACVLDWHAVPSALRPASCPSFSDPTSLGPRSCDLLLGSEIMYTASLQHRQSLAAAVCYYLAQHGRFLLLQSVNRDGAAEFVQLMTQPPLSFRLTVSSLSPDTHYWLRGMHLGGERQRRGFVQRQEEYALHEFTRGQQEQQEEQQAALVTGSLPPVRYLLDEQSIRQLALHDSADLHQASRIMDIATSDAVLIHENKA